MARESGCHTTSAAEVKRLGFAGLHGIVERAKLRCRAQTLHKILVWAEQASAA